MSDWLRFQVTPGRMLGAALMWGFAAYLAASGVPLLAVVVVGVLGGLVFLGNKNGGGGP